MAKYLDDVVVPCVARETTIKLSCDFTKKIIEKQNLFYSSIVTITTTRGKKWLMGIDE